MLLSRGHSRLKQDRVGRLMPNRRRKFGCLLGNPNPFSRLSPYSLEASLYRPGDGWPLTKERLAGALVGAHRPKRGNRPKRNPLDTPSLRRSKLLALDPPKLFLRSPPKPLAGRGWAGGRPRRAGAPRGRPWCGHNVRIVPQAHKALVKPTKVW